MNYADYDVRDFALDESFQKWVLDSNNPDNTFWEQWVLDHPEKKACIQEARELVWQLQHDADEPTAEEFHLVWKNIQKANQLKNQSEPLSYLNYHSTAFFKPWYRIAAIFIGILVSAALIYFILQNQASQTFTTRFGETKTIVLPDQSEVKLNANSSLTLKKNWDSHTTREIWLEGEAFFSVVHQKNNQKFIVHVNNVAVEVLGTKFNVSDRHGKTQVVLNTGKVKLNLKDNYLNKTTAHQEKDLLMEPGEMVEISHTGKSFIQKMVNPEVYTAWKDNKFVFQDSSLHDIAQLLKDNYGLTVVIGDSTLANRKFTSSYTTNDVTVLLKALAKSFNLEIIRSDGQILLEPKDISK